MALVSARAAHRRAGSPVSRPRAARGRHRVRVLGALGLAVAGGVLAGGQAVAVGLPWSGRDAGADRISVAYDDGSGQVRTRTLSCGGAVRAEQLAACRQLDELGGPLAPVPAGQMCSMIYGGPQTAHVTGMWRGEPVDETYRRTNGCEVARWKRMIPALPEPTSGGPHILAA